ncbi:MAG: glycosyltransferase family 39 protein [Bacteroidota bacterium]
MKNKWFLNGCLFSIVIILFFLNFYAETLFYRPLSLHQWRQADCLSITKNYFEEGMHFFSPKIHSLRAPGGKAVSEFPLLNYTVAGLWKIFGEHEFIYRILEYIIFLLSVFVLFNTLLRYFTRNLFIFFAMSVLLTSPLLVYYSFNFLSDVPALSLGIMSFCFTFRFYKTQSVAYFYFSLLFATLAVLLKASALFALASLIFFSLADLLNLNSVLGINRLFNRKVLPFLFIVLSIVSIRAWYAFALDYNTFNNGFFLLTIMPIWDMKDAEIYDTLRLLFNNLFPAFLNRPMLTLFFLSIVYVFTNFKKLDVFLRYCLVLSMSFFILYLLIFFKVFDVHDYYLVNLFIFPVVVIFCLADILSKTAPLPGAYSKVALAILFILNAFYSAAFYRLRNIRDDKLCSWYPFISKDERQFFRYSIWYYERTAKPLETILPNLRRLGIKRDDVFISVTDESPNISLYFMDQKGYAFSRDQFASDSLSLEKKMSLGAKYLMLTDTNLKRERPFAHVAGRLNSILRKDNLELFKLKN